MNPLLDFSALPRYDAIQPEHVAPAITELLAENRHVVERLARPDTPATWEGFMAPLTDVGERLSRAWGIVGHLHGVNDIPPWREAYNARLPEITRFYTELGQNQALFACLKKLRASEEYGRLSATRQRIVDNDIRNFRLSGADLPEADKPRFQAIQEELAALEAKFSENLLDATNAWAEILTDEAGLTGIPADVRAAARAAAEQEGKSGWKFTLHAPSYGPVMQYAENRELRARMYRAYATRASEHGEARFDNTPLIQRILELRREAAQMLGYRNYAEVSLVPKMADSPQQVAGFLREIAAKARPFAEKDIQELRAFARSELGMAQLESWDLAWAAEKLKEARYAFSDDEVKQYLPEPQVLTGLFRVIERLFGVQIQSDTAPAWHPAVRFFRIQRSGRLVGQFYLDLYARPEKRGGAWMDEAITRRRLADGDIQTPVAYLNCNFPAPLGDKPACFTHDEVITLFHECGHGLHHLLSEVEELAVSGIHGVEWDAVELPSQFMENFCWEWEVLKDMTRHVDSGAPLPRELFDKMLAAKNFQSGMAMLRQVEFALFDLLLHGEYDPSGGQSVLQLLDEVRREVAVVIPPEWQRFPHSFAHIFAGGYSAGYYSYKWAEVLSADAYAVFEESALAQGTAGTVLDSTVGARFWREILAVGGSRPALDSFRAYRGREPRVDALLRHNGMVTE
ncbi:Oligopeptidase A [Sterolibacterium denitrificans]|uniref:oligopeptidase A n=1 Tax=Sterolibacterium denitrificans TaxID=157592 RepID=A0A7Z7MUJ4_9PROT|nr:M3 family metallopeptidase [Sterolibacterium denitrificans]SMB23253.1 Oligopeptidase A [Sterolibacterium denitrificans]